MKEIFENCTYINQIEKENKNLIETFISNNDIDVDYIKRLAPDDRNASLINKLFDQKEISQVYNESKNENYTDYNDEVGILLVKPEMLPFVNDIETFFKKNDIEYKIMSKIIPTKEQWLETYGYMLMNYPNIVNVYISQRSIGIQPILFKHLPMEEYQNIAKDRQLIIDELDRDAAFDQLYCGKTKNGYSGTIRHDVVLPKLQSLGFDNMSGYASSFDIFNYYKESGLRSSYVSYNGIHLPGDFEEKNKNIHTYIF